MTSTQWEPMLSLPVADDRDHIQGPADAAVTLVEYGDYECPYCGAAYPIVKRIQRQMGDQLRFVFRNFPIATSHPHAEAAAEAAEAAGVQGRLWEMHDLLFENQRQLNGPDLRSYAESLALDLERFDDEVAGAASTGRPPSSSTARDTMTRSTTRRCSLRSSKPQGRLGRRASSIDRCPALSYRILTRRHLAWIRSPQCQRFPG